MKNTSDRRSNPALDSTTPAAFSTARFFRTEPSLSFAPRAAIVAVTSSPAAILSTSRHRKGRLNAPQTRTGFNHPAFGPPTRAGGGGSTGNGSGMDGAAHSVGKGAGRNGDFIYRYEHKK